MIIMIQIRTKLLITFILSLGLLTLSSLYSIFSIDNTSQKLHSTNDLEDAIEDINFHSKFIHNTLLIYSTSNADRLTSLKFEYDSNIDHFPADFQVLEERKDLAKQHSLLKKIHQKTLEISEKIMDIQNEQLTKEEIYGNTILKLKASRNKIEDKGAESSLEIKSRISHLGYKDKEFNFQYQDKKHAKEWTNSIQAVKDQAAKEKFNSLLPLTDAYLAVAQQAIIERSAINDLKLKKQYNLDLLSNAFIESQIITQQLKKITTEETNQAIINTAKQKNIPLIIIIFSLVFGTVITFITAKNITEPMEKLVTLAEKIGNGDLKQNISIKSDDEIGQVVGSFNKMAENLKNTYSSLEEKNATIQHSLFNVLQLENNLKFEHERMRAVFSSVSEGIIVIDTNYSLILLNKVAEKLFEVGAESVIGRNIKTLFTLLKNNSKISDAQCPIIKTIVTGSEQITLMDDNYSCTLSSGKKFPVILAVSPLRQNETLVGAVIILRDITDEKNLDEAKNSFISLSSHQLRTPLTSIRWFAEMLLDGDAGKLNKNQRHFTERIYQGTDRMINLVNLLLQIARVEAKRVIVEPVAVNLFNITKGVMLVLKSELESRHQKIEVNADCKNIPTIPMDYEVIWQVLQNLISNAIRYSQKNSTIYINIVRNKNLIEYSIKDSGIGIPDEQKDKIFEKFFRTDNALKFVPEGSGLGLSLAKSLVESWDGKIWFESKINNGTTFYVTIPLKGMKPKKGEVRLAV